MKKRDAWAYLIGVALGDGNLSNPNGRAVRLRITCDAKYPRLAHDIAGALKIALPDNSVAFVFPSRKTTYFNISVYSNELVTWMPWKVGRGTKENQCAHVPRWIFRNPRYIRYCLRGLLQTDGSIYRDRGYLMVNFTNNIFELALDVAEVIHALGYIPRTSKAKNPSGKIKYTVRVARDTERLIRDLALFKA